MIVFLAMSRVSTICKLYNPILFTIVINDRNLTHCAHPRHGYKKIHFVVWISKFVKSEPGTEPPRKLRPEFLNIDFVINFSEKEK